jgi:hypothetical protein
MWVRQGLTKEVSHREPTSFQDGNARWEPSWKEVQAGDTASTKALRLESVQGTEGLVCYPVVRDAQTLRDFPEAQ